MKPSTPSRMPYRIAKCDRAIRGLSRMSGSALEKHVYLGLSLAGSALADAGDTHGGMSRRALFKIVELEGFERLFEAPMRSCTGHGFGRAGDGIVAVFTEVNGRIVDGVAECSVAGRFDFAFKHETVFMEPAWGDQAAKRIHFSPLDGFRMKLGHITRSGGRLVPFWWSRTALGNPHVQKGIPFVTDVDAEDQTPGGFFDVPPRQQHMQSIRPVESKRRIGMIPRDWQDRLDIHGTRTLMSALVLSTPDPGAPEAEEP